MAGNSCPVPSNVESRFLLKPEGSSVTTVTIAFNRSYSSSLHQPPPLAVMGDYPVILGYRKAGRFALAGCAQYGADWLMVSVTVTSPVLASPYGHGILVPVSGYGNMLLLSGYPVSPVLVIFNGVHTCNLLSVNGGIMNNVPLEVHWFPVQICWKPVQWQRILMLRLW